MLYLVSVSLLSNGKFVCPVGCLMGLLVRLLLQLLIKVCFGLKFFAEIDLEVRKRTQVVSFKSEFPKERYHQNTALLS